MRRLPARSKRTAPLLPYAPLFRSVESHGGAAARGQGRGLLRRTAALRCCITEFDRKVRWQKQPPAAPLGNLDQKIRGDGPLQQLARSGDAEGQRIGNSLSSEERRGGKEWVSTCRHRWGTAP